MEHGVSPLRVAFYFAESKRSGKMSPPNCSWLAAS